MHFTIDQARWSKPVEGKTIPERWYVISCCRMLLFINIVETCRLDTLDKYVGLLANVLDVRREIGMRFCALLIPEHTCTMHGWTSWCNYPVLPCFFRRDVGMLGCFDICGHGSKFGYQDVGFWIWDIKVHGHPGPDNNQNVEVKLMFKKVMWSPFTAPPSPSAPSLCAHSWGVAVFHGVQRCLTVISRTGSKSYRT